MTPAVRSRIQLTSECLLVGIGLGALLGLLWWLLTPTISWKVVTGGAVVPAAIGHDSWFAADGWFFGLGLILGVGLTALAWPRGRSEPVTLAVALAVAAGLLSITGWALGRVLGPADPASQVGSVPAGEVLPGMLTVDAPAVLMAPLLGCLGMLVMLLASTSVAPAPPPTEASTLLAPPSAG